MSLAERKLYFPLQIKGASQQGRNESPQDIFRKGGGYTLPRPEELADRIFEDHGLKCPKFDEIHDINIQQAQQILARMNSKPSSPKHVRDNNFNYGHTHSCSVISARDLYTVPPEGAAWLPLPSVPLHADRHMARRAHSHSHHPRLHEEIPS